MFPPEADPPMAEIEFFIVEKRSPELLTKHQEGFSQANLSSRFDVGAFAVGTAMKSPMRDDLVAVSTA